MNKRKVLLAALLICFSMSWQSSGAQEHKVNENLNGGIYSDYQSSTGGVLQVNDDSINSVIKSTLRKNTASSSGGAVNNSGTLSIEDSIFEDNKASYSSGAGGAIYNEGKLTIEGSSFVNNNAGKSDKVWEEAGHGGAIYNSSNATITNSTFTGNHAKYGGAIYNAANANIIVGGTFTNNTAQTGGAIENDHGKLTVNSGSTFENNAATRFDGGAILNEDGILNIEENVTFKNNSASRAEDETYISPKGGAIFSEGDGKSKVSIGNGVTFEGNQAREGGGIGLYKHNDVTIGNNVTFKNNQAGRSGGAINVYTIVTDPTASSFSIGNNAVFEGNQAGFDDEEGYTPEGNFVFGGAVAVSEEIYNDDKNSSFTIGNNAVFRNNKAISKSSDIFGYGGALYNAAYKTTVGNNALFEGNISDYGGAVYNQGSLTINNNAVFNGNTGEYGGAIYNCYNVTLGDNAVFSGNHANSSGGAIYNVSALTLGNNTLFDGNSARMGGAIYNASPYVENTIQKAVFKNNEASSGGAIYNDIYNDYDGNIVDSTLNITDSVFYNNKAKSDPVSNSGGAIYNQSILNVKNSSFENNFALDGGGAIFNSNMGNRSSEPNLTVENSQFTSNTASFGGAIAVSNETASIKITDSYFNNNHAALNNTQKASDYSGQGGALWTGSSTEPLEIEGSAFENNTADVKGGAIAAYQSATITDTSFVNNKAGDKGGAVWANDDVTVKATESDVIFVGNSAKDGADIYMDKADGGSIGALKLTAEKDRDIILADGISGAEKYKADLDGQGTVTFNGEIKNAEMNVTNGTLHLAQGSSIGEGTAVNVKGGATLDTQDGRINDYSGGKVNIGENSKLRFDLSSANKTTDKFTAAEGLQSGSVTVEDFTFLPDTLVSSGNMTADEIKESLGLGDTVSLELPDKSFSTLTPLRYVNVQSGKDGVSYSPTGNSYGDFNPAVMAAPVAAQLGGYLTQLDSYDEAFRNMDMYMIMPKSVRQSMKYQNKFASADNDMIAGYDKSGNQYDNTALWARPYVTFENVRLKHGPRVSNVAWGTYFGGDSEMFDLGNGWEGMWGVYAGYNGSHQAYDGVGIYQNGGTLGVTGVLYKNNFFTGLTANVGANAAEASTSYGEDSFALLRTGVASKTGYNFEFADGKFIIQPSWLMSYSFVNTGDYTTSSGIRVNADPLNAMHIEPGLKFIGNGKKGWQPYAGLSIVWNFLDKTDFTASDATLPELSVKPFFKYGVGLRKLYGERFAGYGQIYFANGGRNGVGFQFGGRWTL